MPSKLTSSLRSIIANATINPIFEVPIENGRFESFNDHALAQQFASSQPGTPKVQKLFEVDIPQVADKKHYAAWKSFALSFGGRWVKARNTHLFVRDPSPVFESILKTGIIPDWNPNDFYPTPRDLAGSILDITCVADKLNFIREMREEGTPHRILEPSFGEGVFGDLIAERVGTKEVIVPIEIDPERVAFTREKGFSTIEADFLQWTTEERFQLIVMNPPFNGLEWMKHIQHAYTFLKPGGLLVGIIPYKQGKMDTKSLRWLATRGCIEACEENAFKSSGTNVSTGVVFLTKEDLAWRRKPVNGYSSFDAHQFDITTISHRESYEAIARIVHGILRKMDPKMAAKASLDSISTQDREGFVQCLDRINDKMLQDHTEYYDLRDEDYRCLFDMKVVEWCEIHKIERIQTSNSAHSKDTQLLLELVA